MHLTELVKMFFPVSGELRDPLGGISVRHIFGYGVDQSSSVYGETVRPASKYRLLEHPADATTLPLAR